MWDYVNGTIPKSEENAAVWTVKDQKALALIVLSVSRGQLNYVKQAETSEKSYTLQIAIQHEERFRNLYEHVHK